MGPEGLGAWRGHETAVLAVPTTVKPSTIQLLARLLGSADDDDDDDM